MKAQDSEQSDRGAASERPPSGARPARPLHRGRHGHQKVLEERHLGQRDHRGQEEIGGRPEKASQSGRRVQADVEDADPRQLSCRADSEQSPASRPETGRTGQEGGERTRPSSQDEAGGGQEEEGRGQSTDPPHPGPHLGAGLFGGKIFQGHDGQRVARRGAQGEGERDDTGPPDPAPVTIGLALEEAIEVIGRTACRAEVHVGRPHVVEPWQEFQERCPIVRLAGSGGRSEEKF